MGYQMPFEQVWELLSRELTSPQEIQNWTAHKGYFGENFSAQQEGNCILCILPSNSELEVPMEDFEAVYQVWSDYVAGRVPRKDIRDITFYSKYIISILHQFLG